MTSDQQVRHRRQTRVWLALSAVLFLIALLVVPPLISITRYKIRITELVSAALRRPVRLSSVELRILPLDRGFSPPPGPFLVFGFPAEDETAKLGDVVSIEGLTDNLVVEGEIDTYIYRLFFKTLAEASLSPDESRHLLLETAEHGRARPLR